MGSDANTRDGSSISGSEKQEGLVRWLCRRESTVSGASALRPRRGGNRPSSPRPDGPTSGGVDPAGCSTRAPKRRSLDQSAALPPACGRCDGSRAPTPAVARSRVDCPPDRRLERRRRGAARRRALAPRPAPRPARALPLPSRPAGPAPPPPAWSPGCPVSRICAARRRRADHRQLPRDLCAIWPLGRTGEPGLILTSGCRRPCISPRRASRVIDPSGPHVPYIRAPIGRYRLRRVGR